MIGFDSDKNKYCMLGLVLYICQVRNSFNSKSLNIVIIENAQIFAIIF